MTENNLENVALESAPTESRPSIAGDMMYIILASCTFAILGGMLSYIYEFFPMLLLIAFGASTGITMISSGMGTIPLMANMGATSVCLMLMLSGYGAETVEAMYVCMNVIMFTAGIQLFVMLYAMFDFELREES